MLPSLALSVTSWWTGYARVHWLTKIKRFIGLCLYRGWEFTIWFRSLRWCASSTSIDALANRVTRTYTHPRERAGTQRHPLQPSILLKKPFILSGTSEKSSHERKEPLSNGSWRRRRRRSRKWRPGIWFKWKEIDIECRQRAQIKTNRNPCDLIYMREKQTRGFGRNVSVWMRRRLSGCRFLAIKIHKKHLTLVVRSSHLVPFICHISLAMRMVSLFCARFRIHQHHPHIHTHTRRDAPHTYTHKSIFNGATKFFLYCAINMSWPIAITYSGEQRRRRRCLLAVSSKVGTKSQPKKNTK